MRKSSYALRILTMYKHTQYIWLSFYIPENCSFVWMTQFVRKYFLHQNTESFLSGDSTGKQEQGAATQGNSATSQLQWSLVHRVHRKR